MKMTYEAKIQASCDFVWAIFDNPDMLKKWQPTLKSFKHQSGEPGQPDAVTELVYAEKGKKTIMTETVTERREPHFLASIYDNAWTTTIIVNRIEEANDDTTRFVSYTNMKFKGLMKFMSIFVAKSIRARAEADLNRFKLFVETQAAGAR